MLLIFLRREVAFDVLFRFFADDVQGMFTVDGPPGSLESELAPLAGLGVA